LRILLAVLLSALLPSVCAAFGEGDEDTADPDLIAPSGLVIFYDSAGPMSFVAMTPKDVPADARKIREVKGVACQYGLALPTALSINATNVSAYYGDGSYAKALREIKKKNPEVAGIYDVRVDLHVFSIFSFYHKECTEVTARAFALPSAAAPIPAAPPPAPASAPAKP
jgi:hypothetical protein